MRILSSILLSVVAAVCAKPLQRPTPEQLSEADFEMWSGCYALHTSKWSLDSSKFTVPTIVQLERKTGSLWTRSVRPDVQWNSRRSFQGYWRAFGQDSARVYWSTGLWGLGLALRPDGDSLLGRVWEIHDLSGPAPNMEISAFRRACAPDSAG